MYLAYASKMNSKHIGSTVIHKDVTSAYNIALDVAAAPTGEPGYALWYIWPSWSSEALEEYIHENSLSSTLDGNMIHSQQVYLDEYHIERFAMRYNVKPFIFHQHKGEAVFIPPNCPHSVSRISFRFFLFSSHML